MMKSGDVISEQKINLDINDIEKAEKLFEFLKFKRLVNVKYKVIVYEKDFNNKTINEINSEKQKMYNEIKATGIKITDEIDVKKAYELISKKLNNN